MMRSGQDMNILLFQTVASDGDSEEAVCEYPCFSAHFFAPGALGTPEPSSVGVLPNCLITGK